MVVWRLLINYGDDIVPDYYALKTDCDKAYREAMKRGEKVIENSKMVKIISREDLAKELNFAVGGPA